MNMIEQAQVLATKAHAGQVRPFTGEAYIGHPARVVGILQQYYPQAGENQIAAAWLHDVIEDCGVTAETLIAEFGTLVAYYVTELTKPNEPTMVGSMLIKAADLIDNVGTIADVAPHHQAKAYLAKKAPQVLRIAESLQTYAPALAEALAQAYWRNWDAVS